MTVGVLNVASQDAGGFTLGVVNVSRRATASLGLVNVIFDGRTSLDVWGAETGTVLVGESGIRTAADVRALGAAGAHAVLVGEALMRAKSPGAALSELLEDTL